MLSSDCIYCLVKRQKEAIEGYANEELKSRYMREVLEAIAQADERWTAPVVISQLNGLHQRYFQAAYSFEELKRQYNTMLIEKEPHIAQRIR